MEFSYSGVVYEGLICRKQSRPIGKLHLLWVTLTSLITQTSAQGNGTAVQWNCTTAQRGSGIIQSPAYPQNYPNGVTCKWSLRSYSDLTNIRLQFSNFDTESSYDKLWIYDEKNIVRVFSGKDLPPVLTLGKVAELVFTSDASLNLNGFHANFTSFDVENHSQCSGSDVYWCRANAKCISRNWVCDGQWDCIGGEDESNCLVSTLPNCGTTMVGSGTIQSPNYPENYPDSIRCTWSLRSYSNAEYIKLQFQWFGTEMVHDEVSIVDEKNVRKIFSGSILPPVMTLGKTARLIFTSDSSVNNTGFIANFTSFDITRYSECTGNDAYWCTNSSKCISRSWMCDGQRDCIMGEDETGCLTTQIPTQAPCGGALIGFGYLQSPNYPGGYPNNARCSWNISSGSADKSIRLQFADFVLENNYDYVNVYDERNTVKRYTGVVTPSFITLGKNARVEFFSDSSNTNRGFRATFHSFNSSSSSQCLANDGYWCVSSQKCISSSWRCDGYQDCANGDDESWCPSTTTQVTISPQRDCEQNGKFWCSRSVKCVPQSYKCDNYNDCIYGEDEVNCSSEQAQCQQRNSFWCTTSRRCIYQSWRCDNAEDCLYGEDEEDCGYLSSSTVTGIVAGTVCGFVLLVLIAVGLLRVVTVRRLRQANVRRMNYQQTASRPVPTVWSTPANYVNQFGVPGMQAGAQTAAGSLSMDRYAPPSYDATIKAYSTGLYSIPPAPSAEESSSSRTTVSTTVSAQ